MYFKINKYILKYILHVLLVYSYLGILGVWICNIGTFICPVVYDTRLAIIFFLSFFFLYFGYYIVYFFL